MRQAAMTSPPVESLISTLYASGVSFRRRGEHLAVQGGKDLPPAVLEAIRQHKAELLALCDKAAAPVDRGAAVSGEMPPPPMPVALPPGGVRWHSDVLGEAILLLPDDAPRPVDTGGLVIYRPREVAALRGITPAGLRWLHEVKKVWGGDVLPAPE